MEVQFSTLLLIFVVCQVLLVLTSLGGTFLGGWLVYRTRRDQPLIGAFREPQGEAWNLDEDTHPDDTDNAAEDWGGELMDRITHRAEERIAREYEPGGDRKAA